MSQASVVMPTSGVVSGVNFATDVNNGFDAVRTMWSGASSPATDTPEVGQLWLDTSLAPLYAIKIYDGTTFVRIGSVDGSTDTYIPRIGSGTRSVAAAATVTLGGSATPQSAVTVTGSATITSFGANTSVGEIFIVTFAGVCTLTYNATSMILPGQANIVTAANDVAICMYLGSSNWQVLAYQPIATLLGSVGTVTGAFVTNNIVTPAQLTASQNNYAPSGIANAAVLELTTNNANYSITGLTSGVSGRQLMIRNANATGGGKISFPTGSTLSSTGNRFAGAIPVTINPGQQADFMWDLAAGAWVSQNVVSAQPAQGVRRNLQCGTVAGGSAGFSGSTAVQTRYRITADQLTLNDADGNAVVASALDVTADITVTGAGGLDSTAGLGFTSSAWYSAWAIFNPVTLTFNALLSTSITAPTMPSGYTFKTRVGWDKTGNSAALFSVYQADRTAQFNFNLSVIGSGTFGTFSSAAWQPSLFNSSNYTPPTANRILFTISQGAGGGAIGIAPGSSVSFTGWGAGSGGLPPVPYAIGTNISTAAAQAPVAAEFTLWSTNIYLASGAPNGAVWLRGWEDNL